MSEPELEPTYHSAEELMNQLGPDRMDFMHSMMTPDPDPDPSEGYHTSLSPHDEEQFQQWVRENNIPFDDSAESKYDLRGFFAATMGDDESTLAAQNGHLPATYKTPYDRTMTKESVHAKTPSGSDPPHWEGNKLVDHEGEVVYVETPKDK